MYVIDNLKLRHLYHVLSPFPNIFFLSSSASACTLSNQSSHILTTSFMHLFFTYANYLSFDSLILITIKITFTFFSNILIFNLTTSNTIINRKNKDKAMFSRRMSLISKNVNTKNIRGRKP